MIFLPLEKYAMKAEDLTKVPLSSFIAPFSLVITRLVVSNLSSRDSWVGRGGEVVNHSIINLPARIMQFTNNKYNYPALYVNNFHFSHLHSFGNLDQPAGPNPSSAADNCPIMTEIRIA